MCSDTCLNRPSTDPAESSAPENMTQPFELRTRLNVTFHSSKCSLNQTIQTPPIDAQQSCFPLFTQGFRVLWRKVSPERWRAKLREGEDWLQCLLGRFELEGRRGQERRSGELQTGERDTNQNSERLQTFLLFHLHEETLRSDAKTWRFWSVWNQHNLKMSPLKF